MGDPNICKICLDSQGELINPCRCSGTASFLHAKCLQDWILSKTKEPENFRCEICNFNYKMKWKDSYKCSFDKVSGTCGKCAFFTVIIIFEIFLGVFINILATSKEISGVNHTEDIILCVAAGIIMVVLFVVFVRGIKELFLIEVRKNWVVANYEGEEVQEDETSPLKECSLDVNCSNENNNLDSGNYTERKNRENSLEKQTTNSKPTQFFS